MRKTALEKIRKIVRNYRDDISKDTSEFLKIPSITPDGGPRSPAIGRALDYIEGLAGRFGFSYRDFNGEVGVVEAGSGNETIGILLHIDVVQPGDNWQHPPFGGEIADGQVWGRGAIDDKGPAISTLYALRAVLEAGVTLKKRVKIIFGTDEESDWLSIENYLKNEKAPDMSFVPDGEFPVINGEKGMCNVLISSTCMATGKPSAYDIVSFNGGIRPNIVPDSASAIIHANGDPAVAYNELQAAAEQYNKSNKGACIAISQPEGREITISAKGKSAHGSLPELGHNAVLDMAGYLGQLDVTESAISKLVRFINDKMNGETNGKNLGIYAHHDFLGDTTVNLGMMYNTANGTEARLNIRFPYGISKEEIPERVRTTAAGYDVVVEERNGMDPLYVDPADPLIGALQRAYTQVTGQPAELKAIGGTTYAKSFPRAVSFGPVMPNEEELAHQVNERASIDSLVRNAEIYAAAIYELNKI